MIRGENGYKMGNKEVAILCYANYAVIFVETEDDLHRNLNEFNKATKKKLKIKMYDNVIGISRCILEINGNIVEKVIRYLGIELSSYGNVEDEVL